jgi:tRNA pseudouridine55 synthase
VHGVVLVDKPLGITSQTAVTRVKHLYGAAKAGHTGTLDPMAGGLLPICLGEATKFSQGLIEADKTYVATLRLGLVTRTGDLEGEVLASRPVACDRESVTRVLDRFVGEILQTPPLYSALKHAGQPLYRYARAGIQVERAPRPVRIDSIELLELRHDTLRIRVACGKGTYIRALAEDIGEALGCGACLAALTRTSVGSFRLEDAAGLDELRNMPEAERRARLLPVDALVATLPRVDLDADQARRIVAGRPARGMWPVAHGLVRIYGPQADYLGVAAFEPPDRLVAHRLMAASGGQR